MAVDRRAGLPFRAGWAALDQESVVWPLEDLELADLEPDPEPRRCLLAHLVRTALASRAWWDRVLCPTTTLVVPAGLSSGVIHVLRSDAAFAGSARSVRVEPQAAGSASTRSRRSSAD